MRKNVISNTYYLHITCFHFLYIISKCIKWKYNRDAVFVYTRVLKLSMYIEEIEMEDLH
jgi:hypothetical protein